MDSIKHLFKLYPDEIIMVRWLKKALATNDTFPTLQGVTRDGNYLLSGDGNRVHRIKLPTLMKELESLPKRIVLGLLTKPAAWTGFEEWNGKLLDARAVQTNIGEQEFAFTVDARYLREALEGFGNGHVMVRLYNPNRNEDRAAQYGIANVITVESCSDKDYMERLAVMMGVQSNRKALEPKPFKVLPPLPVEPDQVNVDVNANLPPTEAPAPDVALGEETIMVSLGTDGVPAVHSDASTDETLEPIHQITKYKSDTVDEALRKMIDDLSNHPLEEILEISSTPQKPE